MNGKFISNYSANQQGSALFMTVMILAGLLVAALSATNIIMASILLSGLEERSTLAYFAAEAGAERALWEARKNNFDVAGGEQQNVFVTNLSNSASFDVDFESESTEVKFVCNGTFGEVNRTVVVTIGTN